MTFPIFDPTVKPEAEPFERALRRATLEGQAIGLLDNGKLGSAVILDEVARQLCEVYGARTVVRERKPSAYRPAPEELLEAIGKRVDLVVTGIGD